MIIPVHNPVKKKTKRAAKRRAVRKEKTAMAAKKKRKKTKKTKRAAHRNPTPKKRKKKRASVKRRAAHRAAPRRSNPARSKKKRGKKRRRNPDKSSKGSAVNVVKAVVAGALVGAGVILAATFAAPKGYGKQAYLAGGAASLVGGVALAKKHPMIAAGVAMGGVAAAGLSSQIGGFLASKLLGPGMTGMGEVHATLGEVHASLGALEHNIGALAQGSHAAALTMGSLSSGDIAEAGNPFLASHH